MSTKGTVVYLRLMRNIHHAFLDKSISLLQQLTLIWETVFFFRIWRKWLHMKKMSFSDHFVTQNVYVCTELNGHMLLNTVYNVVVGVFPERLSA